jgi:hypothetical protein
MDDLREPPEPGQTIIAAYDGQEPTYVVLRPPGIVRTALFLGMVSPFAVVMTGWMIIVVLSLTGHVFGVTLIPPDVQGAPGQSARRWRIGPGQPG